MMFRFKDRTELLSFLHKRVDVLPEGYFKRRMQMRVKLLEEVPPEALWALAVVVIAAFSVMAVGKVVWRA